MSQSFSRFMDNDDGATAIEYSVIGVSIAVVLVTAAALLGDSLIAAFEEIGEMVRSINS